MPKIILNEIGGYPWKGCHKHMTTALQPFTTKC